MLKIHQNRRPGEIVGFYMVRGGAPCVSESYTGYFERFIVEHQLSDVFMLSPERENDYLGFDPAFLVKHLSPAILIADIPVEIDYVLCAVGPRAASRNFSRTGNDSYPVQDCPMDDE